MKRFKNISFLIIMLLVMTSFSQCSSAKKLQETTPINLGEVYYQSWVAGVRGGGSGVNVFIPIESNPNNIELDSIYFKGQKSKLEITNSKLAIGRFLTDANQMEDVIMSIEPQAEYGNKAPELPKKAPFELKEDQCVISYKQGKTIKYYKILNMIRKQSVNYQ